jgi:hypothetical protein
MAEAGRWPKQGDGRSRAMAEAGRWLGLSFMCRCSQSPAVTPDSSTAKMYRSSSPGACRVRACGRAERALCRASTVACGVRTSMWPVVAVMHADNGAGPSVDVPCGLCTGREARRRGRCTGMWRQRQRQQGQRGQRRQQRQLCRSPARALVPELRMKIQQ